MQRPDQAEVLVRRRHDLVGRTEVEYGQLELHRSNPIYHLGNLDLAGRVPLRVVFDSRGRLEPDAHGELQMVDYTPRLPADLRPTAGEVRLFGEPVLDASPTVARLVKEFAPANA